MRPMNRFARRLAAVIAIAALAFAQLAVSAFACPAIAPAPDMAVMSDCEKPLATPNLCERHCDYGASSVQAASFVAIAPQPALLPWRAPTIAMADLAPAARAWLIPTRIEAPPPLLLFGALRI